MGWEWEVEAWVNTDGTWRWQQAYAGSSKRDAKAMVRECRRNGIGAIRTTWRPS